MANIAADMFVGRERFATLLLMRLTETVILWISEDQSFWDDIEEGPRPLGPLGLQQVCDWNLIMGFINDFQLVLVAETLIPNRTHWFLYKQIWRG